jgi:hypothetical protein
LIRSLEPFLSALDNAPIFIVAVVFLLALLIVSLASRYLKEARRLVSKLANLDEAVEIRSTGRSYSAAEQRGR